MGRTVRKQQRKREPTISKGEINDWINALRRGSGWREREKERIKACVNEEGGWRQDKSVQHHD